MAVVGLEAPAEQRHPLGADVAEEAEAIARADVDVEEDDVDRLVAEQLLGGLDRGCLEDAIALELEVDAAEHPQAFVVVDDENRVSVSGHVGGGDGSGKIAL